MTHEKVVAGTDSPTRYTKIIRNPGAGTKYNRTYQVTDYVSRYTKVATAPAEYLTKPIELEWGCTWVSTPPFIEMMDVVAHTATYINGDESAIYRYRMQTRPTGGDNAITNGSWTTYNNTGKDVTLTLPAGGVDVRFHCQGKTSDDQINSFTGWQAVAEIIIPPLELEGGCFWDSANNVYEGGEVVTATTALFRNGPPPLTTQYRWEWTFVTGYDAEAEGRAFYSPWTEYPNDRTVVTYTITENDATVMFNCKAVDGEGNQLNSKTAIKNVTHPAPPEPEPEPEPDPLSTVIGNTSMHVNDILIPEAGVTLLMNDPVPAEVFFDGDASPTYQWEARNDYPLMVGQQSKQTVLTFPEEGAVTVTCTLSDNTSTDSPSPVIATFYIVDAKTFEELKNKGEI